MGILDFLRGVFGGPETGRSVENLAARIGVPADELRSLDVGYREFEIPKRSGGKRRILAPEPDLKRVQRRILQRALKRFPCHPAVEGFEEGHSIVTHARRHVGRAVVVHMDIRDFFGSTRAKRVRKFFRKTGWCREAARLLEKLCTYKGRLPQGAPTSPKLSNLVNYMLDARLTGLARRFGGVYSRYADDLTFSFDADDAKMICDVVQLAGHIASEEGYGVHRRKKLHVWRRHNRQVVTGLVVNERVNLPRKRRRWLRAVEHRLAAGGQATISAEQLAGWRAFEKMVAEQG